MAKKKGTVPAKKRQANRQSSTTSGPNKSSTDGDAPDPKQIHSGDGAPEDFPIVGVGASAGGLQPLKELLDAFPDNPGIALVIVQHLDPTRKSLTPELLAPHTSMQLCEVVDNPRVKPNSVYVI